MCGHHVSRCHSEGLPAVASPCADQQDWLEDCPHHLCGSGYGREEIDAHEQREHHDVVCGGPEDVGEVAESAGHGLHQRRAGQGTGPEHAAHQAQLQQQAPARGLGAAARGEEELGRCATAATGRGGGRHGGRGRPQEPAPHLQTAGQDGQEAALSAAGRGGKSVTRPERSRFCVCACQSSCSVIVGRS